MTISKRILILFMACLLLIKLSWGITYLEKVNENLDGNPQIYFSSPNYVLNDDAYDYFLVYALTLDDINIPKEPILKWYEIMIYSFMAGYLTSEITN